MEVSFQQRLEQYQLHLAGLDREEYADSAVLSALIDRDLLEAQLSAATPAQLRTLRKLDDELVARQTIIAESGVLPNWNSQDRRRWWWFLHEGPQVRAAALASAR